MSRFPSWTRWAASALALVAGAALYVPVRRALEADPLEVYRQGRRDDEPGVELREFRWQALEAGRLVAHALVDRVETDSSRDEVALYGVREGVYFTADGSKFGFTAKHAVYYPDRSVLDGTEGGKVTGNEFALSMRRFRFEPGSGELRGEGPVLGVLNNGALKAASLRYRPKSGEIAVTGLVWQGPVPQQARPARRRNWRFTTPPDSVTTVKGAVTTMQKVTATDGEVTVKADKAEYNRDTDVLVATGNVSYFGVDLNASATKATVYRKERRVVLAGAVDVLVKAKGSRGLKEESIPPLTPILPPGLAGGPQPEDEKRRQEIVRESKTIRDYPLAVTADQVEYWYAEGSRRAVLTGSPQARQTLGPDLWRVVWAHRAEYDAERERIKLLSSPDGRKVRLLNSLGDDMQAVWIDASTAEGEDDLSAAALEATMPVDEDEVPREGGGTGGGTGGGRLSGPIGG
jgi:lipopolysaccharide export system protein LptA